MPSDQLRELRKDGWNTDAELEFVKDLGTHSDEGKGYGARAVLKRYLESMERRERWGMVNPYAVRRYAEERLREL